MNDFTPHTADLFGDTSHGNHDSRLGETFLLPPFTVLNAREGWWQERKRAWLALGIQSELGRGGSGHDEREQQRNEVGGRVFSAPRSGGLTWNTGEALGKNMNGYRDRK